MYLWMASTVVEDAAVQAQHGHKELDAQPDGDGEDLRVLKDLFAEFQADNHLSEHDGAKHPALSAHTSAPDVCYVSVVLPIGKGFY